MVGASCVAAGRRPQAARAAACAHRQWLRLRACRGCKPCLAAARRADAGGFRLRSGRAAQRCSPPEHARGCPGAHHGCCCVAPQGRLLLGNALVGAPGGWAGGWWRRRRRSQIVRQPGRSGRWPDHQKMLKVANNRLGQRQQALKATLRPRACCQPSAQLRASAGALQPALRRRIMHSGLAGRLISGGRSVVRLGSRSSTAERARAPSACAHRSASPPGLAALTPDSPAAQLAGEAGVRRLSQPAVLALQASARGAQLTPEQCARTNAATAPRTRPQAAAGSRPAPPPAPAAAPLAPAAAAPPPLPPPPAAAATATAARRPARCPSQQACRCSSLRCR